MPSGCFKLVATTERHNLMSRALLEFTKGFKNILHTFFDGNKATYVWRFFVPRQSSHKLLQEALRPRRTCSSKGTAAHPARRHSKNAAQIKMLETVEEAPEKCIVLTSGI